MNDFATIPLFKVSMAPREVLMPKLEEVLYSGFLAEGEEVHAFEAEFARAIDHPHLLAMSSGSAALRLALVAAGVGPGDEVISTPVTAEPTNVVIHHSGATIVWADCDPQSGLIDPDSVKEKISPRTKAVVAVDYAGTPVALDALNAVTSAYGVSLIEDAAQAFGACYHDQSIGRHADFVVFSFQAIKRLTSGDGGALAFKDPRHLERLRRLRWFGMDRLLPRDDQWIDEAGFKYTMNNITAAMARIQLMHIAGDLERQIDNGDWFDAALDRIDGIDGIAIPRHARSSYWLYTVLLKDQRARDKLRDSLLRANIACGPAHRRNDLHPIFAASQVDLPGVEAFHDRMLHIPSGWWVGDAERHRILSVLEEAGRS
jgi:perosamine synthetase